MGGFVRAIRRVFSRPQQVVIQQPAPQPAAPTAPQTAPTQPKTASAMAASQAGSYGGQTIMTGASGVEDEANVQKTVLGGGTTKKKKKA
jgi:hypothetical protein|tara:strand:- start:7 stop:273 length:267 start_codon:yes stop_codon:yes gene_type:complete